jgi:hypothetical protein
MARGEKLDAFFFVRDAIFVTLSSCLTGVFAGFVVDEAFRWDS